MTIPKVQKSGVIAVDSGRCLACRECEVACSLFHENQCSPNLSRIHIEFDDFVPGLPTIIVCKQCEWPACYFACAAKWEESAIYIEETTGARVINPDLCRGCGACVLACPLMPEKNIIGYKKVDRQRIYLKCDLCHTREEGPICVAVCPGDALTYVPAKGNLK
jgi:carbon-monoxide dehydrogenase iron sulfur subunit